MVHTSSVLPTFPTGHHFLAHLSKQKHEQLRQELQMYLKQLCVYVNPFEYPEFDLFLLMELHVNQIRNPAQIQYKTSTTTISIRMFESITFLFILSIQNYNGLSLFPNFVQSHI